MATLTIRLPDDKHQRLKQLGDSPGVYGERTQSIDFSLFNFFTFINRPAL